MLHIITPLYRFELLDDLYKSIPKHNDITWHLSISNRRSLPENDFVRIDERIQIHYLDCEDNDLVTKRNTVFDAIKNGYFYLLDDDTLFLNEAYLVYKKYHELNFQGMIIGRQYRRTFNGIAKRPYDNPKFNDIDTGMVISHFSVLREVKWEWCSPKYSRDCYFWSNCYKFYGKKLTILENSYISIYNSLNNSKSYMTVKKKILNFDIQYEITNIYFAKLYTLMAYVKNLPERTLNLIK
jgi:hypothetical protein